MLSKKPRFESPESPIFNIKLPNTIPARSNGRMAFKPLFEEERQKNVEKLFEMVKPSNGNFGQNNRFGPRNKPEQSNEFGQNPKFGQNNEFEQKSKFDQRGQNGIRGNPRFGSGLKSTDFGSISELSTILGLPELPFEAPAKPTTMSLSTFDSDDNEIDYDDEYSEDGKLQLLPKKSAGKSVARLHKDREQPEVRLVPPPPPPPALPPLQVVGHVLDSEDLKFVPNSPIFNISHMTSAKMLTVEQSDRFSNKNDRFSNKFDAAGRSGKSGDQVLGLPLHLVPPSNNFRYLFSYLNLNSFFLFHSCIFLPNKNFSIAGIKPGWLLWMLP